MKQEGEELGFNRGLLLVYNFTHSRIILFSSLQLRAQPQKITVVSISPSNP